MEPARALVADCPWKFGDALPGPGRGAVKHYDCLSVEDLKRFPLPPLAPDCYLFFWRVASMTREADAVMDAWGFTPTGGELKWVKTTGPCLVVIDPGTTKSWEQVVAAMRLTPDQRALLDDVTGKLAFGMGRTVRNCDEVCVIARRGKPKPLSLSVRSVFFAPVGRHSEKPDRFYEIVEQLSPGPYVELFSRRRRSGWAHLGDEVPPEGSPLV